MIQIREEHSSFDSALPKAARVLQDLRGVPTYESEYGARHPFASYNISLAAIGQRFTAVVGSLKQLEHQFRVEPTAKEESDFALLEATDHLLDSLMEHMDVCGGILRSFFRKSMRRISRSSLPHLNPRLSLTASILAALTTTLSTAKAN